MGWLASKQSKAQLVNEIKRDNPTITEWSLVGNHLWGLYPAHEDHAKFKKGDLLIHVFLLKSFGNGEYGYKCLCESVHPCYYTCPKKFLTKAVVLCQDWRDQVIKYHAQKAARDNLTFSIGQVLDLVNCSVKQVRVVNVSPLRGVDTKTGQLYRIPKKYIPV